jgi:hypothetical protein
LFADRCTGGEDVGRGDLGELAAEKEFRDLVGKGLVLWAGLEPV